MLADRMAMPITIFLAFARFLPRKNVSFPAVRVVMPLFVRPHVRSCFPGFFLRLTGDGKILVYFT
jgi:hypothetical protein